MREHNAHSNQQKIQRPDAQDAAKIKSAEQNATRFLPLPQQDGSDQEGAQGKEQIDAGRAPDFAIAPHSHGIGRWNLR